MKKSFIAIILVVFCTSFSHASVFIDAFAANVNAGDAETQNGAGLSLGFGIHRDASFIAKSTYSLVTKNQGDSDETAYTHFTNLFGVEYTPYIPLLEKYRLSWKSMALIGVSQTEIEYDATDESESEMGASMALFTGIKFDATQTFAPFINLGYHYSMYSKDLKDLSIQGFQAEIGIRFNLSGSRDFRNNY